MDSAKATEPIPVFQEGREEIVVIMGGIVPDDRSDAMAGLGIGGFVGPDITFGELITCICRCTTDRDRP